MRQVSIISRFATFLMLAMLLTACKGQSEATPQDNPPPKYSFRKDGELSILSKDGQLKAEFDIEIVETEAELQRGLKYRESMEPNQGMLFIFDGSRSHSFWMQDTYISLDMLFIDYDNTIFNIAKDTVPFSTDLVEPGGYNKYTLELIAGSTERLSIQKGDKIEWKRTK